MWNQRFRRRTVKLVVITVAGLTSIFVTESAFAQYRHQVAQMCQDKVKAKGLKGDSWKAEYQKCKLDPIGYK
jgi:secreted Zn-dependent insulinase-like peptidase